MGSVPEVLCGSPRAKRARHVNADHLGNEERVQTVDGKSGLEHIHGFSEDRITFVGSWKSYSDHLR